MKRSYTFLCMLIFVISCIAANAIPKDRLFYFERSKNRNYICYDVVQNHDVLDMEKPVHAYWIRVEEGGGVKELSFFQRKMAFGYKIISRGKNSVTIHLTAYDKLPIQICKRKDKWVAITKINGKDACITRMFAQLRSPNSLHVEYVDIFGTNMLGEAVKQRIYAK